MKKLLIMLFLGGSICSFGQSTSPEVIATAGGHFQNASSQISWTLGEPITETITDGSTQLTQGFHQTNLSSVATYELDENMVFNAYPNPTIDLLSVEIGETNLGASLQLIDASGRIIHERTIEETTSLVDFTAFAAGTYRLNLVGEANVVLKTFTIQKIK